MDSLAATGRVFSRAYCANLLCAPSRTSIFTGPYPKGRGEESALTSGVRPCQLLNFLFMLVARLDSRYLRCVPIAAWVVAGVWLLGVATWQMSGNVLAADYAPELPPMTSDGQPAIVRVTASSEKVLRFGKFELTIELSASYDNPFDPGQVDLTADFTTPAARRVTVPGFFYQPYRNRNEGEDSKSPLLDAAGEPCWKVRFTPTEVGQHTYVVRLQNRFRGVHGQAASVPGHFTAVDCDAPGFIRVAPDNGRYFEFDNGQPFFPVGQNLQNDWPYYRHSQLLAAGGANCARVWTFCHYTWLEWTFKGGLKSAAPGHWMRSYAGAGRYNQRIAWIADDCLDRWTRDGIRVMLCLGNGTGGGELTADGKESYSSWAGHPYNAANGGFLKEPQQFWTDQGARRLYRQRLRYILARWGYSPTVWAIEFWNELGPARPEMVAWHREMGQYARQLDPNRHLLTTSTWDGNADKFAPIWDLPEIDFTQGHHYGALPGMIARIAEHEARWHKPLIIGEGAAAVDPRAVEFHNSLWAPLACGAAGTTLPWWWRNRIEPQNLFFHYRAVANFAHDVPWNRAPWRPLQVQAVKLVDGGPARQFSPVLVAPIGADWGSKPRQDRFRIEPDGSVPGVERLAGELFGHGRSRAEWRSPPVFEANFPQPGRLILHVSEVRHGAAEIRLDGKSALRDESSKDEDPGKGAARDLAVDVPAGRHEIALDNAGSDVVRFGYFILTNYRDAVRWPDLDVWGRQTDDLAVLWIHNRLHQWPLAAVGFDAVAVGPAVARIAGLADGRYQVEWWDTYQGSISKTEPAEARGGALELHLPTVERDVACKIMSMARNISCTAP